MKLILPWSLPAIIGVLSWMLSWAFVFAFPPNSYHPYANDMQMTFNRIFALMTYVGPAAAIFAVIGDRGLQIILHSSEASRVLSAECRVGDIFVVVVGSIWVLACAQDMTARYRSNPYVRCQVWRASVVSGWLVHKVC